MLVVLRGSRGVSWRGGDGCGEQEFTKKLKLLASEIRSLTHDELQDAKPRAMIIDEKYLDVALSTK